MKNCLSAPIYVGIDLTEKCNLRCIHCRVGTSKNKQKQLTLEEFKGIIDELSKMKIIQIILSGGEPFIHKNIYEIIFYAINSKIPDVSLVTNGTLLNDKIIKKVKKIGLKKISLSLDGLKKNHDKIRGKGNYQKTILAVSKLIKENFEVKISITINKINKNDLIPLGKRLFNLGVKRINVGNLMPCGRGRDIWFQTLNKKEKLALKSQVNEINKKKKRNFILFENSFLEEPKLDKDDRKIEFYLGCRGGRTSCAILSNGNVVACKMLPNIIAGNIKEKKFEKIWKKDENWKLWRENKLPLKCKQCKYGLACRGGCKAVSYAKYGRLDLPDPRCIGPF